MESYIKNEKQRSLLTKIGIFLFVITMLGTATALMLSYLSPFVIPYDSWLIAFLGLATPLLMLANLLFLLILGIKLSRWAFVPLLALILGVGYIGDFWQIQFTTKYPSEKRYNGTELKIITYNVHGFNLVEDQMGYKMKAQLQYVVDQDPDIVAFQEVMLFNDADSARLASVMNRFKYKVSSFVRSDYNARSGLMIFSKYPLINPNAIRFVGRENSAMFADVIVKEDTIRIFSNHLQSTQFNLLDRSELMNDYVEDAARKVGSTLRDNYKARTFQADTISSLVRQSPYPTIVVGDFNDTPMSYAYNIIKGDFDDAFCEAGQGYGYTYTRLYKMFRIDFVLHTADKIETLSYDSPLEPYSDHKPVIAILGVKK